MNTKIFMLLIAVGLFSCSTEEITTESQEAALTIETPNTTLRGSGLICSWTAPIAPFGTEGTIYIVHYPENEIELSEINCIREYYFTHYCEEIKMTFIQNSDPRWDSWVVQPCDIAGGGPTGKSTFDNDVNNDPRTECTSC